MPVLTLDGDTLRLDGRPIAFIRQDIGPDAYTLAALLHELAALDDGRLSMTGTDYGMLLEQTTALGDMSTQLEEYATLLSEFDFSGMNVDVGLGVKATADAASQLHERLEGILSRMEEH